MEGLEGMVIPGGESTTIGKLLVEWDMLERCAGASWTACPSTAAARA